MPGGDGDPGLRSGIRREGGEHLRRLARLGRAGSRRTPSPATRCPGPMPTMMLSASAFPSMSAPATVTPPRKSASNGANRVSSVLNGPSAGVVAVVGDHLRRDARAGAGDEVEDHVAVDVGHRHRRGALERRERDDRLRAPCRRCRRGPARSPACPSDPGTATAYVDTSGMTLMSRHQAVVLVVEAVAVDHEGAGVLGELRAQRHRRGLERVLVRVGHRRGHVDVVHRPTAARPVVVPAIGSTISITWKSLTWMCIGCSSLLRLVIFHSSTELSRGWISGMFGNVLSSNS